jgi:hypothetical protein
VNPLPKPPAQGGFLLFIKNKNPGYLCVYCSRHTLDTIKKGVIVAEQNRNGFFLDHCDQS